MHGLATDRIVGDRQVGVATCTLSPDDDGSQIGHAHLWLLLWMTSLFSLFDARRGVGQRLQIASRLYSVWEKFRFHFSSPFSYRWIVIGDKWLGGSRRPQETTGTFRYVGSTVRSGSSDHSHSARSWTRFLIVWISFPSLNPAHSPFDVTRDSL